MSVICTKCEAPYSPREFTLYGRTSWCGECLAKEAAAYFHMGWDQAHWNTMFERAGVPSRFFEVKPTKLAVRSQKLVVEALAGHRPLFLQGPVETGKTLTMALLAKILIERGTGVQFIGCASFTAKLRSSPSTQKAWAEKLIGVRHLFIDDVGAESDKTGWWTAWLGGVLDERYVAKRPTTASANNPSTIEPRIFRRLTEFALMKELSPL